MNTPSFFNHVGRRRVKVAGKYKIPQFLSAISNKIHAWMHPDGAEEKAEKEVEKGLAELAEQEPTPDAAPISESKKTEEPPVVVVPPIIPTQSLPGPLAAGQEELE